MEVSCVSTLHMYTATVLLQMVVDELMETELAGQSTGSRRCAETCGTGQARTPTVIRDQARTATETELEHMVASSSLLAVVIKKKLQSTACYY
jgi:hypothetical protein